MKHIFTFSVLLFAINCLSQVDSLTIKKDTLSLKDEGRLKVAGSVLASTILNVPGDFSQMGRNISSDWKRTAIYSAGIVGLIAVDKYTTGFYQDEIETRIDYKLPSIKPNGKTAQIVNTNYYILYPTLGLYLGSIALNNKKGQVVALNAFKSLAYSYVVSHLVLKTLTSRNRPQRTINGDNPVIAPFTRDPWDFGNYDGIKYNSASNGTSFPSFHATAYFAIAKVFQMEYNNYWIPYTFVTAVFLSNIKDHNHWVSDLAVGGLVGTIIGRSVVKNSQKQMNKNISTAYNLNPKKWNIKKQLIPQVSSRMVGFHFIGEF